MILLLFCALCLLHYISHLKMQLLRRDFLPGLYTHVQLLLYGLFLINLRLLNQYVQFLPLLHSNANNLQYKFHTAQPFGLCRRLCQYLLRLHQFLFPSSPYFPPKLILLLIITHHKAKL